MENLVSDNRSAMLEILDELRRQVESDELLQLFIVSEDGGGFTARWSGTEDRQAIGAFVIGAGLDRMGFARIPSAT